MQRAAPYDRTWWRSPWFWALVVWLNLGPLYLDLIYSPILEKSRQAPPQYLVSPEVDAILSSPWMALPLIGLSAAPSLPGAMFLDNGATWMAGKLGYPAGWHEGTDGPESMIYRDPSRFRRPSTFLSALIVAFGLYFSVRRARYELKFIRLEEEAAEAQRGQDSP